MMSFLQSDLLLVVPLVSSHVFHKLLREILGKFIHAADINTRDPLVLVRITASWALANICDSLHHCNNVVTSKRCFVDLKVASHLIVLLIECSLPLTKDSDKVLLLSYILQKEDRSICIVLPCSFSS